MYYYAFTVRCMNFEKYQPTLSDFKAMMTAYKKKYTWTDIRYHLEVVEKLNGNHNVHIHGMVSTPKKVVRKMLDSVLPEGYVCTDHSSVRSKTAWIAYITQSQDSELQLENLLTAGVGPDLLGDDEDISIETEEYIEFMKSLNDVNVFEISK